MKVKRLIQELSKYKSDADVICSGDGRPIIFVYGYKDRPDIVLLETENDCDMASQLEEHFKEAANNPNTDELDFYMDLIEVGVTVDCIRRYMGDEAAQHMSEFCQDHGLLMAADICKKGEEV